LDRHFLGEYPVLWFSVWSQSFPSTPPPKHKILTKLNGSNGDFGRKIAEEEEERDDIDGTQ